jgi:hypothetical protein
LASERASARLPCVFASSFPLVCMISSYSKNLEVVLAFSCSCAHVQSSINPKEERGSATHTHTHTHTHRSKDYHRLVLLHAPARLRLCQLMEGCRNVYYHGSISHMSGLVRNEFIPDIHSDLFCKQIYLSLSSRCREVGFIVRHRQIPKVSLHVFLVFQDEATNMRDVCLYYSFN